jgi:hypothetical protein
MSDTVQIASFDIGKKNFSFLIEEFSTRKLKEIEKVPLKFRYQPNGTPTDLFQSVLDRVFVNGKVVLYKNSDITQDCDPKAKLDPKTFYNMNDLLTDHIEYFRNCSIILIEKQMMFGKLTNPMAVKLAQHCYSFFTICLSPNIKIIEYDAFNKTQVLGCKMDSVLSKKGVEKFKAVDKPTRKKWAVSKCIDILTLRNDIETLTFIKTQKKKDDLADVLVQLQAFKYQTYCV